MDNLSFCHQSHTSITYEARQNLSCYYIYIDTYDLTQLNEFEQYLVESEGCSKKGFFYKI